LEYTRAATGLTHVLLTLWRRTFAVGCLLALTDAVIPRAGTAPLAVAFVTGRAIIGIVTRDPGRINIERFAAILCAAQILRAWIARIRTCDRRTTATVSRGADLARSAGVCIITGHIIGAGLQRTLASSAGVLLTLRRNCFAVRGRLTVTRLIVPLPNAQSRRIACVSFGAVVRIITIGARILLFGCAVSVHTDRAVAGITAVTDHCRTHTGSSRARVVLCTRITVVTRCRIGFLGVGTGGVIADHGVA